MRTTPYEAAEISPLMLAHRMIQLAEDVDRSGDRETASRLMDAMLSMLDRRALQ